jgi:nicotinamidase/pyrazinamidase
VIDAAHSALIVVDMQPDFMPGGALAVAGGHDIIPGVSALMARFPLVVATQDWHPAGHVSFGSTHGRPPFEQLDLYGAAQTLWPDHCVQGTPGAAIHADIPLDRATLLLRKGNDPRVDSYSAFRENIGPDGQRAPTGLAGWLRERGVTRVFACGLARDFCVRFTLEDAVAAGFEAVLLDDLTRSVFPDADAATRAGLVAAGVTLRTGL